MTIIIESSIAIILGQIAILLIIRIRDQPPHPPRSLRNPSKPKYMMCLAQGNTNQY